MGSSYVVADVEYESCAEELRLCGGEATLIKPSDMRTLDIDFPSPLPFKKLGVLELKVVYAESLEALDFRAVRGFSLARGLGGKLLPRVSPRGGCGNELILTLFLNVFPVPLTATASFGCGSAVRGAGPAGGKFIAEGALRPDLGVPGADLAIGVAGMFPVLFRVLLTGNAGKAMLGGPREGREGRGSVVVMMSNGYQGKEKKECARRFRFQDLLAVC